MSHTSRHSIHHSVHACIAFGALTTSLCAFAHEASSQSTRGRGSSDSLASVTTDTGAMAPGHVDFSHYNTPGLCVAAVRNKQGLAERTLEVRDAQLQDSLNANDEMMGASGSLRDRILGDSAIVSHLATVARSCAAHLRFDSTSVADLPDFFTLALFAQDDALARNVMQRWTTATHAHARDAAWYQVVESYLTANPVRVSAAQAVLATMDTSRGAGVGIRALSRLPLLNFAMDRSNPTLARQTAEQIITIGTATGAARTGAIAGAVASGFAALMRLTMISQPSELPALGTRAQKMLSDFPPGPEWPFNIAGMTSDSVISLLTRRSTRLRSQVGAPVDSLVLAYTFTLRDKGANAPVSGRPTLTVIFNDNGPTAFTQPSDGYARKFEQLKRWHAQYGEKLAIRVITPTNGYWLSGVPGSGPIPADTEAPRARSLFQEYFRLPFDLGVVATSFQQRSDGVRLPIPAAFLDKYVPSSSSREGAVLADAQGHLRYAGLLDGDLGVAIAALMSSDRQ